MQRREFLQSAAAAGTGWMLAGNLSAESAAPAPANEKLIGMYVHQHSPYRHPYATETRTTRLLRAMKQSLWELDPRYPDSSARFTIQGP